MAEIETRTVTITPERLAGWLRSFVENNGGDDGVTTDPAPETVTLHAGDTTCELDVPFPPLAVRRSEPYGGLLEHARENRRIGVVLVRRGGYAIGLFKGRKLLQSKVGSRYVQGRTAAGGWSQQRFARRRDNQARELYAAAAEVVAAILLPQVRSLDGVLLGGDRRGAATVLEDKRFGQLRDLVLPQHLDTGDPKLDVLKRTPDKFRAVQARITGPAPAPTPEPPPNAA